MGGLSKIGLDFKSVLFYLVNFGIILWVFTRFLYRPLLAFIDERRALIARSLHEAEQLRQDVRAAEMSRDKEKSEQAERIRSELADLKANGEKQVQQIIAEAQVERARIVEQARAQVETLQATLEKQAEDELVTRISAVVEAAVRKEMNGEQAAVIIKKMWREQR